MDKRRFLKIKLKSLACEARIIRLEEQRSAGDLRNKLHAHRVTAVRRAARLTHLAYGFIRGRRYRQIEPACDIEPDWKEVGKMVKKYGLIDFDETWTQESPAVTHKAA